MPRLYRPMPTFTLAGVSYDYVRPAFEGDHQDVVHSSTGTGRVSRPKFRSLLAAPSRSMPRLCGGRMTPCLSGDGMTRATITTHGCQHRTFAS